MNIPQEKNTTPSPEWETCSDLNADDFDADEIMESPVKRGMIVIRIMNLKLKLNPFPKKKF